MAIELTTCPNCKQKLAIYDYLVAGTEVVCANCETNLRIESSRPLKVAQIPITATFNPNSRPESYG